MAESGDFLKFCFDLRPFEPQMESFYIFGPKGKKGKRARADTEGTMMTQCWKKESGLISKRGGLMDTIFFQEERTVLRTE